FSPRFYSLSFLFSHPATTAIYTLSLHDALPILSGNCALSSLRNPRRVISRASCVTSASGRRARSPSQSNRSESDTTTVRINSRRSEEHTSELQSPCNLVCRLLLEKKKKKHHHHT